MIAKGIGNPSTDNSTATPTEEQMMLERDESALRFVYVDYSKARIDFDKVGENEDGRKSWGQGRKGRARPGSPVVSHLEVGQEESLWGAFASVLLSLVLYRDRTVAFAGSLPLLSETTDWAVDSLLLLLLLWVMLFLGGMNEAVEVLSWSINDPTLRGRNKVEPCRNNCQTRLDSAAGG